MKVYVFKCVCELDEKTETEDILGVGDNNNFISLLKMQHSTS